MYCDLQQPEASVANRRFPYSNRSLDQLKKEQDSTAVASKLSYPYRNSRRIATYSTANKQTKLVTKVENSKKLIPAAHLDQEGFANR